MRGDIFEYAGTKLPESLSPTFKYHPAPLHVSEQARRLLDEIHDIQARAVGDTGCPLTLRDHRAEQLMLIEKYLRAASSLPQASRSSA